MEVMRDISIVSARKYTSYNVTTCILYKQVAASGYGGLYSLAPSPQQNLTLILAAARPSSITNNTKSNTALLPPLLVPAGSTEEEVLC